MTSLSFRLSAEVEKLDEWVAAATQAMIKTERRTKLGTARLKTLEGEVGSKLAYTDSWP